MQCVVRYQKQMCHYRPSNLLRSKHKIALVAILCLSAGSVEAKLTAEIKVGSAAAARATVEGEVRNAKTVWSFRNRYGSLVDLGRRIEALALYTSAGERVSVEKLAPGEYRSRSPASRFSYEVSLDPPMNQYHSAFVSWLSNRYGLLMLGDLLPAFQGDGEFTEPSSIRFSLPTGWKILSSENRKSEGLFEIFDTEAAVFLVGADVRYRESRLLNTIFLFGVMGEWAFSDTEALEVAQDFFKDHARLFGRAPAPRVTLFVLPFHGSAPAGRWTAETRGRTATVVLGRQPSKVAALAQLSAPLSHELFHFWVPNALSLDGEYDWFYEGFTLYQALRSRMRVERMRSDLFLNAIAAAYDQYSRSATPKDYSLLEASKRRWTGSSATIYQKGMLVAFLYDLTLRGQTKGKRSLDHAYGELARLHMGKTRADGNSTVIQLLKSFGMESFVSRFIENNEPLELPAALEPFGLRTSRFGNQTRIAVSDSLSRQQRDLLRRFGL